MLTEAFAYMEVGVLNCKYICYGKETQRHLGPILSSLTAKDTMISVALFSVYRSVTERSFACVFSSDTASREKNMISLVTFNSFLLLSPTCI